MKKKAKRKAVDTAPVEVPAQVPAEEPEHYIVDQNLMQALLDIVVSRPFGEVYQVVDRIRQLKPLPKDFPRD